MVHFEKPLMVEYHEGYVDVFVWRGLPGKLSKRDLYFFITINLFVMIYQFIEGARSFSNYSGTFLILIVLIGFFKGFKVMLDSIGFTKYEVPYITRLAEDFIIWGDDPPLLIEKQMKVIVRPKTSVSEGVVYLYLKNERHIAFVGKENHYLEEFAQIILEKYKLQRGKNVGE